MLVNVYRSPRKELTYIYLPHDSKLEGLPDTLRETFGEPELVVSLHLTPDRKLARYSGEYVLSEIEQQGFFLQMPPIEREDTC